MTTWHPAASLSDLSEGQCFPCLVDGVGVLLIRKDDAVYALRDQCTHHPTALLSDGYLDGHTIECARHGACFDIRTGDVLAPPAMNNVQCYEVRIDGDVVLIRLK